MRTGDLPKIIHLAQERMYFDINKVVDNVQNERTQKRCNAILDLIAMQLGVQSYIT